MKGFPIRKSPDLNLLDGSPELIADYHVLHRLLPPRHPLYALINLTQIRECYEIFKELMERTLISVPSELNSVGIDLSRFNESIK